MISYIKSSTFFILGGREMENELAIQRQELVKTSICYVVLKRLMDIVGALIGLILASPVMLMIAILIKIEDPKGPIFFSHLFYLRR